MTLRLGIVQINVTDLEKARDFYVNILGMKAKESLGPNRPFELEIEGSPTVLIYPAKRFVPSDYPNQTGVVLVFYTDDIKRTMREWADKGVFFVKIAWSKDESGIAESPFGPFIAFRDPFGNVHELLQPWRVGA
jgi:catechol 2,3-dioxygenase-like lactoylglutathione lyase family enzyme